MAAAGALLDAGSMSVRDVGHRAYRWQCPVFAHARLGTSSRIYGIYKLVLALN